MRCCPKCKSSDYNNKYFVLMINECGHSLCKNCVENIYARNVAPCPTCGRTLKKNSFWEQTFDDPQVEKEVYFRHKVKKIFVLKEDDFPSLKEFNDYLELVETYMFNLVNNIEVEETNAKIVAFQKENEELIAKNRNRKSKDDEWIAQQLAEDKRFRNRVDYLVEAEKTEDVKKDEGKEAREVIQEIMSSDMPAQFIVNNKKRQVQETQAEKKERQKEVERIPLAPQNVFHISMLPPEGERYSYQPVAMELDGWELPSWDQLLSRGYLAHMRAAGPGDLAGGYTEGLGCYRALMEASSDLFW